MFCLTSDMILALGKQPQERRTWACTDALRRYHTGLRASTCYIDIFTPSHSFTFTSCLTLSRDPCGSGFGSVRVHPPSPLGSPRIHRPPLSSRARTNDTRRAPSRLFIAPIFSSKNRSLCRISLVSQKCILSRLKLIHSLVIIKI